MKKSRYTEEQIIGFLKEAEAGFPIADLCRREGFSVAAFYSWRAKFGGMEATEAQRLRSLERENSELKKLLAEAHLDISALKVAFGVKPLTPQAKREGIRRILDTEMLSERRACSLVGLSRSSWRNPPQDDETTATLKERIKALAHERRRFGYRRIHDMLKFEGVVVNHKRVYRLYTEQKLSVKRRKKAKRPMTERAELLIPDVPNQVWSIDFVMDSLANGRKLKCLTIADDKTHECVDIAVDHGISGLYVTRVLEQAAIFRGFPHAIRTDGGPEFTSRAFMGWMHTNGIEHLLIQPGKPTQNAYIESFNGKFRDECLNEQWFETLAQAKKAIANWRKDYNEVRPHSSCGRIPPAIYAQKLRQVI
ncbi:MAG: IS3 family transposase [Methylotenera sp.]